MKKTGFTTTLRRIDARLSGGRVRSIVAAGLRPFRSDRVKQPAPPGLFDYIAADIVNNCNLRCPFCLVDYDNVHHTQLMDEPTFRSLLRLAPAVPEAGFWLSCLHEPTLHPRLADYLSWIPVDQRRKFWFTTNLARPLPDALIAAFAQSGLHHINVSLDSFDEKLFAILRKHGRVAVFRNNLERLVEQCRRTPGAPALRYITMAFRSNLHEIPAMVRWMNESGNASEVEIRYTFNTANITDDFRREHFLRPEEWDVLRASLKAMPYTNYALVVPPPGYDQIDPYLPANWFDTYKPPDDTPLPAPKVSRPLQLRARSNGRLHLNGQEHLFSVKVVDLEDPVRYFEEFARAELLVPTSA